MYTQFDNEPMTPEDEASRDAEMKNRHQIQEKKPPPPIQAPEGERIRRRRRNAAIHRRQTMGTWDNE